MPIIQHDAAGALAARGAPVFAPGGRISEPAAERFLAHYAPSLTVVALQPLERIAFCKAMGPRPHEELEPEARLAPLFCMGGAGESSSRIVY